MESIELIYFRENTQESYVIGPYNPPCGALWASGGPRWPLMISSEEVKH